MIRPIEIPYSIVLDSNGNGTYTRQLGNDGWYVLAISGTGSGIPTWAVKRNGIFLRPALGPSVVISAGLCSPGTKIDVVVTNGQPNTSLTGLVEGLIGDSAQELIGASINSASSTFTSQPVTASSVSVAGSPIVLTSLTTQTLLIPINSKGPLALSILIDNPQNLDLINTKLIGSGTGIDYSLLFQGISGLKCWNVNQHRYRFLIDGQNESPGGVNFTLANTIAGNVTAWLSILTDVTTQQLDSAELVPVTSAFSPIAGWQAANGKASLTESGTGVFTLVPGFPGQTTRVFGWSMASDGTAAGGVRTRIQGHNDTNKVIAWHSANNVGATAGFAGAAPLGVGQDLDFVVDFLPVGDTALCAVTFNQS